MFIGGGVPLEVLVFRGGMRAMVRRYIKYRDTKRRCSISGEDNLISTRMNSVLVLIIQQVEFQGKIRMWKLFNACN